MAAEARVDGFILATEKLVVERETVSVDASLSAELAHRRRASTVDSEGGRGR